MAGHNRDSHHVQLCRSSQYRQSVDDCGLRHTDTLLALEGCPGHKRHIVLLAGHAESRLVQAGHSRRYTGSAAVRKALLRMTGLMVDTLLAGQEFRSQAAGVDNQSCQQDTAAAGCNPEVAARNNH